MIDFESSSFLAAARAHVASLGWRLSVWAVFASGASLVLNSFAAGMAWFLALALVTGFDALLGRAYLHARGARDRAKTGGLLVWGCSFSIMVFSGMPLYLVAEGGGAGRVLGVLMAASAFVSVMVFLTRHRMFMLIVGAPAVFGLLAMPFLPYHQGPANTLQGALGIGCGVVAFLAYVMRASFNHNAMVDRLAEAHKRATEGMREAQIQRAEAEEANRAKSEFLTMMTHELRTPLHAVIGYAEILAEDAADGRASSAEDANRIEKSARHLLGLIDQLLNLTSDDAGQDALAVREVDMRETLEAHVGAVREEADARGNRISVRVNAEAVRVRVDAAKLGLCIAALVSNAVKFTANGLIAVSAECADKEDGAWLTVSVSDTGIGIAANDLDRIFKPFVQLDAGATRGAEGMGMGLAVAERAARAMGGAISVSSQLAKGSTFVVRVPLLAAAAEQGERAAA